MTDQGVSVDPAATQNTVTAVGTVKSLGGARAVRSGTVTDFLFAAGKDAKTGRVLIPAEIWTPSGHDTPNLQPRSVVAVTGSLRWRRDPDGTGRHYLNAKTAQPIAADSAPNSRC